MWRFSRGTASTSREPLLTSTGSRAQGRPGYRAHLLIWLCRLGDSDAVVAQEASQRSDGDVEWSQHVPPQMIVHFGLVRLEAAALVRGP